MTGWIKSAMGKKWIVAIITAVALVCMAVGAFAWWLRAIEADTNQTKTPPKTATAPAAMRVCSDAILRAASGPLDTGDQLALGLVVNKVKALKNFERDPNCLYIVLQYSIAQGNVAASQDYLAKLEKVYNPAIKFSDAFAVRTMPISTIRENIAFLVEDYKNSEERAKLHEEAAAQGSEAADKLQREKQ